MVIDSNPNPAIRAAWRWLIPLFFQSCVYSSVSSNSLEVSVRLCRINIPTLYGGFQATGLASWIGTSIGGRSDFWFYLHLAVLNWDVDEIGIFHWYALFHRPWGSLIESNRSKYWTGFYSASYWFLYEPWKRPSCWENRSGQYGIWTCGFYRV